MNFSPWTEQVRASQNATAGGYRHRVDIGYHAQPIFLSGYRMSNHYSVPASRIDDFVTALSGLTGFVCLVTANGAARRFSALPVRQWPLSSDAADFQQSIHDIREHHRQITGPDRAGFVAGSLFYEAGYHTVPGFGSDGPMPDSVGWAGLYLWRLEMAADAEPGMPAVLEFDITCPPPVRARILGLLDGLPAEPAERFRITRPFQAAMTPDDYRNGVSRVLEYIRAGDCYQANLSQQFEGRYAGTPWQAWQALMQAIPVPYGGYLDAGCWQLLSISPELFLEIENNQVTSKPIKGTRPRSDDPQEDRALAQALAENPKDRAE